MNGPLGASAIKRNPILLTAISLLDGRVAACSKG